MENVEHFITTRFNVGLYDRDIDCDVWMNERIERFKNYTVKSMQNQTRKDFVWLVIVDDRTSPMHLAKLRNPKAGYLMVHGGEKNTTQNMAKVIREWITDYYKYTKKFARCLTTRLDNDDVLHKNYVRHLRNNLPKQKIATITFPQGLVYNIEDQILWVRKYLFNQFASLLEPMGIGEQLKTVWIYSHNGLKKLQAQVSINKGPMWCWILHNNNLFGTKEPKPENIKIVRCDYKKRSELLRNFGIVVST